MTKKTVHRLPQELEDILQETTAKFRQFGLSALHDIPSSRYDNEGQHLRDVSLRAHSKTKDWARFRWGDSRARLRHPGTVLDLVFEKQKLQIELKLTENALASKPLQQVFQVAAACRNGWAYAYVIAFQRSKGQERTPLPNCPSCHAYLDIKMTRQLAEDAGWNQVS